MLNFIIERGEVGCGVVVVHAVWWLSPRRTGAARRLTDSPNDLLSEPAPLNGRSAAAGKTPTSLVTPFTALMLSPVALVEVVWGIQ